PPIESDEFAARHLEGHSAQRMHGGGPTSAFLPRAKRLLTAQLNRFVNREPLGNVVLTTGA
ncbi:hypothetical protein ACFWIZ_30910, partial [Streptomyces sp. NPDC127044]